MDIVGNISLQGFKVGHFSSAQEEELLLVSDFQMTEFKENFFSFTIFKKVGGWMMVHAK